MIKGRTITLIERTKSGTNSFGEDVYTESTTTVSNVLVQPTAADAVVQEQELYGKHSVFTLHIPKGDSHIWEDAVVVIGGEFGTRRFRQFGDIMIYQEELLPLDWCKQVKFEVYE